MHPQSSETSYSMSRQEGEIALPREFCGLLRVPFQLHRYVNLVLGKVGVGTQASKEYHESNQVVTIKEGVIIRLTVWPNQVY